MAESVVVGEEYVRFGQRVRVVDILPDGRVLVELSMARLLDGDGAWKYNCAPVELESLEVWGERQKDQ